jgi:hypothetical protein
MRHGGKINSDRLTATHEPAEGGPVLCRPALVVPEHVITLDETLALTERLHADHPHLAQILSMIW